MQQGEQVELSTEEMNANGDDENSKSTPQYGEILSSKPLIAALEGETATSLEVRLVQEVTKGKNLLVEFDRDLRGTEKSIAIVFGDRASTEQRTLLVTPTPTDAEKFVSECEALPLAVEMLDDLALEKTGAIEQKAGAPVLISSFEQIEDGDLSSLKVTTVVFYGFSSGSKIPGSDAFEKFLEKCGEQQLCFCSDSVPLTLNAAITRHIKTEDFIHVNLEKEQEVQLTHEYYEVGHELLAKPEALATVLESEKGLRAVVFCNTPSDTDLLEVMLKKKGLKARKLIGNVPDRAIHENMERVQKGSIDILVVTDISGRGFPVEEFDVIVHYAAPEDPEIYLHRLGQPDGTSRLKRVISLVGSMDLGNFHFLKKVVEFEFHARSLPSAEDIAKARFDRFQEEATAFSTEDGELLEYARLVEESDARKEFILYLLHQTLRRLPEVENSGKRSRNKRDRRNNRDDDGNREERGNERNSRGSRRGRDDNREHEDREGSAREERPKPKPTRKDTRFYVGKGTEDGLTEEKFLEVLQEKMGDDAPELKRSCLRKKYSFFDFVRGEEADAVFEAMHESELDGKELVFQRAATLSVPLDDEEDDSTGDDSTTGEQKASDEVEESSTKEDE
ncbi:DEAD/DEAH box helicase [bacterium]|nr:DEAD/DEAH box helicase [bacterium]